MSLSPRAISALQKLTLIHGFKRESHTILADTSVNIISDKFWGRTISHTSPTVSPLFTAERVIFIEHHFASTSFGAVRETFSGAYPEKEVLDKTND
jgi:hypothetical protein